MRHFDCLSGSRDRACADTGYGAHQADMSLRYISKTMSIRRSRKIIGLLLVLLRFWHPDCSLLSTRKRRRISAGPTAFPRRPIRNREITGCASSTS